MIELLTSPWFWASAYAVVTAAIQIAAEAYDQHSASVGGALFALFTAWLLVPLFLFLLLWKAAERPMSKEIWRRK